jgi:hypothetical protein
MKRTEKAKRPSSLHPELRKVLGIPRNMQVSEVLKKWRSATQKVCKPCWELKYCPYGPFVEESPLLPDIPREHIPKEILETECSVFGHICPVLFVAEGFTETKQVRRRGRYISFKTKIRVVRRDNYTCQGCGKHLLDDEVEFDHIIPQSKGGSSEEHNIRLTCFKCTSVIETSQTSTSDKFVDMNTPITKTAETRHYNGWL